MDERDRKLQLKASFKAQERAVLEASMPMSKAQLRGLFEYLDRADAPACDHTLRQTTQYLEWHGIETKTAVLWLQHHGGYCDCEVTYNVTDKYGDIVEYRPGV